MQLPRLHKIIDEYHPMKLASETSILTFSTVYSQTQNYGVLSCDVCPRSKPKKEQHFNKKNYTFQFSLCNTNY